MSAELCWTTLLGEEASWVDLAFILGLLAFFVAIQAEAQLGSGWRTFKKRGSDER